MILARPLSDLTTLAALLRPLRGAQPAPLARALPLSERTLAEALRDTGLPEGDLLGAAPDAATPFFLRPGFGERRR